MADTRPATVDDAAAWARVQLAAVPYFVTDAAGTAHELRTDPADAVRVVVEEDGAVLGIGRLRVHGDEDHASLLLVVDPAHRHRGLGATLLGALAGRLAGSGKDKVVSVVEDDDDSRAAAAAWGVTLTRQLQLSAVDPATVGEPRPLPEGYTLTTCAQLGPRAVWEVFNRVVRDDPSGLSLPMPYADFLDEWDDPRARPGLSFAAVTADGPAAFTLTGSAGDRAWSNMTGTLPAHRGRGLALTLKQHSLRAVARQGVTRAICGNDGANTAMLAVNRRLGYRPLARPWVGEKPLR